MKQRIIVQNHISNHTVAVIPIIDIVKQYILQTIKNYHATSKVAPSVTIDQIQTTCHQLGLITSIQFMDLHVLQHESGIPPSSTNTNTNMNKKDTPPSYLIIHFQNRIFLYPIPFMSSIYSTSKQIVEITSHTLNKTNITSKQVIPIISTNILAIGCSDGAMRFYSILDKKIVKSVRGPNGKNDPVVGIISMNNWDWSSVELDQEDDNDYGVDDSDDNNMVNDQEENSKSKANVTKIMTICASGTAYLWELQVAFSESTGCVRKFHLRPPLAKIDCFSYLINAISSTSSSSLMMSPTNSSTSQLGSMVQRSSDNVHYDSTRHLLFWTVQPTHNSSLSKSYVLVWDMSPESIALSQRSQKALSIKPENTPQTPLHYPKSILLIPTGDFILSDSTMIFGLMHPSFPCESYTCLAVSRDGNISLIASSYQQHAKSSTKKVNDDASVYYYFTFSSMKRAADEKVLGNLRYINDGKLRITKVASSYARPDVAVMATNVGLVVITLNDEDALITGTLHSCFHSAKTNSSGFIGAGNKILLVEDSSVYRATVNFNPTAAVPNPTGHLSFKEMVLFYKSPPALHKSIEFQTRHVRMPPRLLPSPSGKFLCLFWHTENRYEIIHNSSITIASRKPKRDDGPEYSPAVDVGDNVLSFAWVGDEDVFALLFPPEMNKNDSGTVPSKKKNRNSLSTIDKDVDDEDKAPIDPDMFKPRVELKVLVGVNKDAVEFSGSLAAATGTFLGTLALRGRHKPTQLFGGPVLCVGSLSQDKESSQMDGMAYFYCRRINSEENDNRASSFTSVGPPLPYPDLVVWDEDGKICAVFVGRRVALYLVDPPNFTLLSTTHLGTADEYDAKVQSAKFLHGVLYCSTQTSVQCIFLGDIENKDVVCELDRFTLSSSTAVFTRNRTSIRPQPQPMPLIRPSILGYFHGSLLVSTVYGVHAISLSQPIIRIGSLLASGHYSRAQQWFDAIGSSHHEALANFLDRRGFPDMAIELSGLSLETIIDFSLRYGFTEFLMETIETHGIKTFHMIDMGQGVGGAGTHSAIVSIGTYLLCQGKGKFVLHMATVCLSLGESGRKEALILGSLLVSHYPNEARDLIERAITECSPDSKPLTETWPVAMYIKRHVLQS